MATRPKIKRVSMNRPHLITWLERVMDERHGRTFQLTEQRARGEGNERHTRYYLSKTGGTMYRNNPARHINVALGELLKENWPKTGYRFRPLGAKKILHMITGKDEKELKKESRARTKIQDKATKDAGIAREKRAIAALLIALKQGINRTSRKALPNDKALSSYLKAHEAFLNALDLPQED